MSSSFPVLQSTLRWLLAAAALGAVTPPLWAQAPARTDALRAFLHPVEAPARLNGAVLVSQGHATLIRDARGLARFATGEALQPGAIFQAASAAKPFTATAVLQLRDAGRLNLDDPVARHLPGFPFPDITVRHLLNHTSGLPDLELFEPLVAQAPDRIVTGADLIPALAAWDRPLASRPGEAFRYSNINYQLLAEIVRAVSGRSFADYTRDQVLLPAGMTSTYVLGDPRAESLPPPVANHVHAVMFRETPEDVRTVNLPDARAMRPYRYEGYHLGSTVGDQNLFTTVDDLRRFDQALREGRLLSLKSQAEAYAPTHLNDGSVYRDAEVYTIYQTRCSYGLGWEVCDHPSFGRIVGHAGYNRGIATLFYRNPDRRQVIAVFDNGDTGDFAAKVASIANLLNGKPALAVSNQRSLTRAYGARLVEQGVSAALVFFNGRRTDVEHWGYTGGGLNRLGYDLLRNGHEALADEVFRLNLTLHPDVAAYYDSWGDGLAARGRNEDAIISYRRALELQPDMPTTAAKLEALNAE